ncbi:MAG: Sir2 family NAD-dependent protein deacetylase, partial [Candidatus Thorarchaeota archaeon]
MNDEIKRAAEIIRSTDYLIALTGAGVSRESNIPTFRGEDGLWRNYDPMELATPSAFAR